MSHSRICLTGQRLDNRVRACWAISDFLALLKSQPLPLCHLEAVESIWIHRMARCLDAALALFQRPLLFVLLWIDWNRCMLGLWEILGALLGP